MEFIREWAYAVCVVSIAGGVFLTLAPDCGKKSMKFIMGLIFLILTLNFIKGADLSSIFDKNNVSASVSVGEVLQTQKEIFEKVASENIKEVIKAQLNSIDISAEEIRVRLNCDENLNAEIKEVIVIIPSKYKGRESEAEKALKELNIKGSIVVNGEQ